MPTTPRFLGLLGLAAAASWVGRAGGQGDVALNQRVEGTCACDVTSVGCDANCCCDPDCATGGGATVRLAFTGCRKEVFGSRRGVKCSEAPVVLLEPHYINPSGSVKAVVNTESEYYSRLLSNRDTNNEKNAMCIVYSNINLDAPFRNVWHNKRAGTDVSDNWQAPGTGSSNVLPGSWYRVGDRVYAIHRTTGVAAPFLPLPRDIDGGFCDDSVPAFFLDSQLEGEDAGCTRAGTVEAECADGLSIARWRDLALAGPPALQTPADFVATAVAAAVSVVDAATGAAVAEPPLAFTYYRTGVCYNAVRRVAMEVEYVFSEDQNKYETTAFRIVLHVGEVSATPVLQRHSIFWRPSGSLGTPARRSGNPGYTRGVAIPTLPPPPAAGAPAVTPGSFGLPLGLACSAAATSSVPVDFLHDVVSTGCSVELSLAEFSALCVQGDVLEKHGGPAAATVVGRVAMYGNADPAVAADWTDVVARDVPPASGAGVYDSVMRSCTFRVGYDYTFIIRRTGKVYNPQDTIAGVLRDAVYTRWQFTNNLPGGKQRFHLRWRASFIRQSEVNVNEDAIKAPTLLPAVSDDIFYPFQIVADNNPTPVENNEL